MTAVNPPINIYVVGDPNSGKANFIRRFQDYCSSYAEVRRKNKTVYLLVDPSKCSKFYLHDVVSVEAIEHGNNDDIEMVFFCYAAYDPGSFQSLEKWIRLMKVGEKKIHSFLVADLSNLGSQQHIANIFSEQANKLKVTFGIKSLIKCCFDDERAYIETFAGILKPYIEYWTPLGYKNNSNESSTVSGNKGHESSTVSGKGGGESSTVSGKRGGESSTVSGKKRNRL